MAANGRSGCGISGGEQPRGNRKGRLAQPDGMKNFGRNRTIQKILNGVRLSRELGAGGVNIYEYSRNWSPCFPPILAAWRKLHLAVILRVCSVPCVHSAPLENRGDQFVPSQRTKISGARFRTSSVMV